jgi:hypothetical protein
MSKAETSAGGSAGTERREHPALIALKQWELDTDRPASPTEGNAFIDGFNAAVAEKEASRANWIEAINHELASLRAWANRVERENIALLTKGMGESEAEIAKLKVLIQSAPGIQNCGRNMERWMKEHYAWEIEAAKALGADAGKKEKP